MMIPRFFNFEGSAILTVGIASMLSGCTEPFCLEYEDLIRPRIEQIDGTDSSTKLNFSGLTAHSAMTVKRTEILRSDSEIWIKVWLETARKNKSGSFSVDLDFGNNISRVYFGENRKLIWKR